MNIIPLCDFGGAKYFLFSENVPSLVYYSHVPLIIISFSIAILMLFKLKKELSARILSFIFISFGLWMFFSLLFWANNRGDIVMTSWALTLLVEPLIYIGSLYLVQTLIKGDDISFQQKVVISLLYLPIILSLPTKLTLSGFDISNCLSVEGPIALYYSYIIEGICIIWIIIYAIKQLTINTDNKSREKISLISIGIIIFLVTFSFGNMIGSFTNNWKLGEFGLIGMPIFVAFLAYTIVKFKVFNIAIIGRNVLILALLILIGSLITITDIYISRVIISITFIISIIFSIILIKATRKEVEHLNKISSLASELKSANSTLSEKVAEQTKEISRAYELEKKANRELEKLNETKDQFIMITQHNMRNPVISIEREIGIAIANIDKSGSGYTRKDLIIEKNLKNTEHYINNLKRMVDDFLNITTLKKGSQILNLSNESIEPIIENIINDFRIDMENMNITIDYPTETASWSDIRMDKSKIREAMTIIIENAIKYNVKDGKIIIKTEKDAKAFKIIIENTGVGIDQNEKEKIFERLFYRSKEARIANPRGMGVGLSVARAIVRAHHGDIDIHSDGENMGAKVVLTLPFDFMRDLEEELGVD